MNVTIAGKRVRLTDADILGVGGEARVYRHADLAVKIFHPVDRSLPAKRRRAADRVLADKFAKMAALPSGLPDAVVAPLELVVDARNGAVVGFAMRRIDGAEDLRRLGQRSWREGVVDNETVLAIFRRIHSVIDRLHGAGVVVGDLNDCNIIFAGDEPWFIDVDSMQLGAWPCVVATERFLDPALYGVDLTKTAAFTPATDWYAFSVMLFQSLLYCHPYGGVHSTLPTLLRRAQAGHSVLQSDVRYPKAAVTPDALPDELRAWFGQVFDEARRERFPERLLDITWTRCACGLVHARARCPGCSARGVAGAGGPRRAIGLPSSGLRPSSLGASPSGLAISHGRCEARRVLRTAGRIHAAVVQGGLKWLLEEGGVLRREDGAIVMQQDVAPGMAFGIQTRSTWIGWDRKLVRIEGERIAERVAADGLGNEPAFAATSATCFRVDAGWLTDTASGRRIGQVLDGQTWLAAGERLGFGFYRPGLLTVPFVFEPGKPGLRQVEGLPPIRGRLLDVAAAFGDDRVLFQTQTLEGGRVETALHVIGRDGVVVASKLGAPDDERCLAAVGGKAIVGERIVQATDDGLLSLVIDPATRSIRESTLFADTEPFTRADARVLPGPGGTVYLVTTQEILQLTLLG